MAHSLILGILTILIYIGLTIIISAFQAAYVRLTHARTGRPAQMKPATSCFFANAYPGHMGVTANLEVSKPH